MSITDRASFRRIHIDILGPFPKDSQNYQYVLLVVDSFSRFPEAFSLKTQRAEEVAETLYKVICLWGAPNSILSDNGRNFVSNLSHPLALIYHKCHSTYQFSNWFRISHDHSTNAFDSGYNSVTILLKLCRKSNRNKRIFGCQLFFSISSESESILIPSQVIGDVAKNYRFTCELFITDMHVSMGLKPSLIVHWDVEIWHHASGTAIQFNDKIAIFLQQARIVHRILATKKYIV